MALNDPADVHPAWAAAFNAQDLDGIMALFEDDAIFVPQPGIVTAGDDARAATAQFLAMGLPINLTVRHVLTAGDIALVAGDWILSGTAADGSEVNLAGSVADVLRRGDNGWKFIIDNPFGTA